MKNQKRPNDATLFCLSFECLSYPLRRVKPCWLGNVSMVWLVSYSNWFSNLWIQMDRLFTGRRMINSENHLRGYMAYFDKKFGQKWLFRLFLHSTYQLSRKSKFAGALSPWRRQKRAAGRLSLLICAGRGRSAPRSAASAWRSLFRRAARPAVLSSRTDLLMLSPNLMWHHLTRGD